jgi:hypothetical protein
MNSAQKNAHMRMLQTLPVTTHYAPTPQPRNNFSDWQRARHMNFVNQERSNTWMPGAYEKQEA